MRIIDVPTNQSPNPSPAVNPHCGRRRLQGQSALQIKALAALDIKARGITGTSAVDRDAIAVITSTDGVADFQGCALGHGVRFGTAIPRHFQSAGIDGGPATIIIGVR